MGVLSTTSGIQVPESRGAGLALSPYEGRVGQIGREILDRARAAEPHLFSSDWWSNQLQDRATADLRRKIQLFRFVDVFPTLKNDRDVLEHLTEYFIRSGVSLPHGITTLVRAARVNTMLRSQLAALARSQVLRMARRFIAGQTADEAIATVLRLRRQKMAFTMDILGEACLSETQADWYADQCQRILRALTAQARTWPQVEQIDRACVVSPDGHARSDRAMPRVNLSVKLTSLSPHFDPIDPQRAIDSVLERLRPIVRLARQTGAFVNVDMEQYEYKDLTLAAFRQLLDEPEFRGFADMGIVLQAYLQSTPGDLTDLLDWVATRGTPIAIRLVKGAYWDFEVVQAIQRGWPIPVLTEKWRCDAQYESLSRTLLDHRQLVRPAIASHNIRSLAAALAYAEQIGASPREFELQMLFGMGDPLKRAVADMGYTLRIYTPYGEMIPGMAYLIRRLLENTANESFVRATFSRHESPEVLLADPEQARPSSPPLPRSIAVDPEDSDMSKPFELEPMADFSRPEAREQMQNALRAVREQFGRRYPLVIGGEAVTTDGVLDSLNPSQADEVVGRACVADISHVHRAVAAARKAFDSGWSRTSARERAALLDKAAELMRHRRYELAAWMVYESGKPWREADADVCEAIDYCRFYGREMQRLEDRPRQRHVPGQENAYIYEPRGVVAVISPWNFPLAILTGMTSAALAAGNTVIMKPAEQSPIIAASLMEILTGAGFPPGVVNYLPGPGETVGAGLVEHVGVDVIAFTGSRQVGVQIHEQASRWRPGQRSLKRVIAEMGGKNAIIIDADADLDEAVEGVVVSAFGYAGQKCSACSRVIVHNDVRQAFTRRLIEAARAVIIGPADKADTVVGPLIDDESRRRVLGYIEEGKQEGKLVYQADIGTLPAGGYYVAPTIFDDVPPTARIAQEEIFGPVLALITAGSFDEALRLANATEYALTGGVYSRNPAHVEQAKRELRVGNLYINQRITGALVDRQPFGGLRMSGIGSKAGGPDYLVQFLEPRTITENTLRHGFTPDALQPT